MIATIPENFVPLLEVQESREDELVSGAAPLSYPVGHLNITSVDWDADFVTADNAYSRYIHSRPRSQLCVRVPSCTLIGSTVLQVVLFSLSALAA